ncbi:MAG: hypothetical protein ACE5G7_06250 [Candidatus Hydrothermarchaeaceae archaeon]
MHERGQITLEAILALGAAIIVLVSLVNLNWGRFYLARDVGEAGEAKMMGELLASSINNVYANGEGFSLHLGRDILDYEEMKNLSIPGIGLMLPLEIDVDGRTINVSKNMSKTGGGQWTTTISVIPLNITRVDPTSEYPETSIRNNGTRVVIYADRENIAIYQNGARVD